MRACLSVASWSTNPGCWWELYSSSTSSNVQDYQIGVTNYQPSSWQYFLVQGSQFFLQHPLIHWHAFSQQPGMWSLKGHNIIVSVWQSTRYVQFSGTTYIMIFRFFRGSIYQTTGRNWSLKPLSGIPGFTIVCGITSMSCGPVVHLHHGLCAVQSLKLWSSAHISVHWTDPWHDVWLCAGIWRVRYHRISHHPSITLLHRKHFHILAESMDIHAVLFWQGSEHPLQHICYTNLGRMGVCRYMQAGQCKGSGAGQSIPFCIDFWWCHRASSALKCNSQGKIFSGNEWMKTKMRSSCQGS